MCVELKVRLSFWVSISLYVAMLDGMFFLLYAHYIQVMKVII
jgi:hypothetical protein